MSIDPSLMKTMIRIRSTRPGFWRAGVQHPAEPTFYEVGYFTDEQLEALKGEPVLDVAEVELNAIDHIPDRAVFDAPPLTRSKAAKK